MIQTTTPRKNPLITLGALMIVGAATLFGGYYYVEGTPQYSLYKLQEAISNHDVNGFNEYFDTQGVTNSLFDGMWKEVQKEATKTMASNQSNPWAAAGASLGLMMIEAIKPRLKDMAAQAIESNIKESLLHLNNAQETSPKFELKDLKVSGMLATATIVNPANQTSLGIVLQQQPTRKWRVTGFDEQYVKNLMSGLHK